MDYQVVVVRLSTGRCVAIVRRPHGLPLLSVGSGGGGGSGGGSGGRSGSVGRGVSLGRGVTALDSRTLACDWLQPLFEALERSDDPVSFFLSVVVALM